MRLAALLAVLAVGCAHRPELRLATCRPEGAAEPVLCGTLAVPEHRDRPSRTISLNVVVVPAIGEKRFPPLFNIAGGPGVAVTGTVEMLTRELRTTRLGRDVVLVDQRGTGRSNGLACRPNDDPLAVMWTTPAEASRCAAELSGRADPTAYTTAEAVADLDDVRRALGQPRLSFLGLSYGGRVILAYLRAHPDEVARAVLLAPASLDLKIPSSYARDGQRALDLVLDECAHDASCAAAFPELPRELAMVLARLDHAPEHVTVDGRDLVMTRSGLGELLRGLLYTTGKTRLVPLTIHQAFAADWTPVVRAAIARGHADFDYGMYLSVTCAEDLPFIDVAAAARSFASTFLGAGRILDHAALCARWPHATVPARFVEEPARASVPVLILVGGRDPVVTEPAARAIARTLPNAKVVVVPALAHTPEPDGISHIDCYDGMIRAFLDGGDVDTGCVATMRATPFVTTPPR